VVQTIFRSNTGSPDAPQAYLVYLTFDESFNLIESKSGMLQATTPEALGELAVANLNIENNGFVYIYVNNNSGYAVNFDNLRIAHKLANVMEVNNYYPGVYSERSRRRLLNSSLSYPHAAASVHTGA
jgi:hypothetical protein